MIPVEDLKQQHREICEMMKVLTILVQDETVRGTGTVFGLFQQLADKVHEHFALEERTLYRELLTYPDDQVRATAQRFLSGSYQVKKFFADYLHNWCHPEASQESCEAFLKQTDDVFTLLKQRMRVEDESFYTLAQDLQAADTDEAGAAARH